MNAQVERRTAIRFALTVDDSVPWRERAAGILRALGYDSPKTLDTGGDPASFAKALEIDAARLPRIDEWRSLDLVFQLTGDELPALSRGAEPATSDRVQRGAIDSFLFISADLRGTWRRKELTDAVRVLNRATSMPAILLFRHEGEDGSPRATIAVIDRRDHKRLQGAQVVGRISLIKDVDLHQPHRAHLEILTDLSLGALGAKRTIADFRTLYDGWLDTLSAAELNKRFYGELANWFAWASTLADVTFPKGQGNGEGAKETALIRLLTRLMFVWFIKEKGLVPPALFSREGLEALLTEPPHKHKEGHNYYLAVLQNLFFATLNTECGERAWLSRSSERRSADFFGHNVFRHQSMFRDSEAALALFDRVPFLNGGLFQCLDVLVEPGDPRAMLAEREGQALILRVDGFSEKECKQPKLPNRLFFGGEESVDLSGWYGKGKPKDVPGLIELFERYKFTVEENTPLEEEAALDPELLGKVFENLLASYNEDTRTTARNKSGSFYTPREVVDFMVDEALVAWLVPKLEGETTLEAGMRPVAPALDFGAAAGELSLARPMTSAAGPTAQTRHDDEEAKLRHLLSYASHDHDFSPAQADRLIAAIEACRAIDPAVGSGAFPLGLLQKLVHVLGLLDPGGEKWKARNRASFEARLAAADAIPSPSDREAELASATEALAAFERAYASGHTADYTRKLYLIERVLHGVDVQPVAVQITKLRCFISLAVSQVIDDDRPNRGVTPLPNLETKFVAANTLTPLHKRQGTLASREAFAKQRALREASRAFFAAANSAAKRRAQERIKALRKEIADELAGAGAYPNDEIAALAKWDPFDPNAFAPFFDGEWMFGLEPQASEGDFDLVLANPPYVRQEKIEGFQINGQAVVAKPQLKRDYATYAGTADLFVFFYERALRLLKPAGALAFITSNKWYRAGYGKGLRLWLVEQARVLKLVDFGDAPVFEAIAYPTILIATRREAPAKPVSSETIQVLNWTAGEPVERFPERFAREAFALPQASLAAGGWQFEPQAERDLLRRLRERGQPLGEWCGGRMRWGVKTGLNEAFVIDGTIRLKLIGEDPACARYIKPYLRGRDIKRWRIQNPSLWLIFTREIEIADYPSLERHLKQFRERLEPRPADWDEVLNGPWRGRGHGMYRWFDLQSRPAFWRDFEETKIIIPAIAQRVEAAPDHDGFYANNKTSIAIPPNLSFGLAILNSSSTNWFAQQTFASKAGGFLDFEPRYSSTIPIPPATPEQQALVTTAVDAILSGAGERARLEALLNAFVYELFFPEDLAAANLSPFRAARDGNLAALTSLTGLTLAQAADTWSRQLADPASKLYATLFSLRSLDAVRIIEGR